MQSYHILLGPTCENSCRSGYLCNFLSTNPSVYLNSWYIIASFKIPYVLRFVHMFPTCFCKQQPGAGVAVLKHRLPTHDVFEKHFSIQPKYLHCKGQSDRVKHFFSVCLRCMVFLVFQSSSHSNVNWHVSRERLGRLKRNAWITQYVPLVCALRVHLSLYSFSGGNEEIWHQCASKFIVT